MNAMCKIDQESNLALSVVIPTFNRVNRLKKTLESLIKQSLDKELFEIVVVDDGSNDGTADMFANFSKGLKHHIRYYWQENNSAASARNMGIMEAKAPNILLMDDDILVNRDHLKFHFDLHMKYPESKVAVLGQITPGPEGIELLRWEESDLLIIGYTVGGEPIISSAYLLTADVSLKKEFLIKAGLFSEGLPVIQDMDLAFRLEDLGLSLIYCREAIAIHTEPLDSLEKLVANGKKYGRGFAQWYGRVPLYQKEIWKLGGRFNGGWDHVRHHPWGYLKDALRRWSINKYTIKPIMQIAAGIPVTNPPKKILRRLCKEIWAYYYRDEFERFRMPTDQRNEK